MFICRCLIDKKARYANVYIDLCSYELIEMMSIFELFSID